MNEVEQPALGGVGVDSINVALSWAWESGWRARISWRLSGSGAFREQAYAGRDEAELHALISDHLAGLLGLV